MSEGSNRGDQPIVFINYRRTDAGWPADYLASELQRTFGDERPERQALDEIHREEVLPLGKADFVNGDDVRMLQTRRRRSLDGSPSKSGSSVSTAASVSLTVSRPNSRLPVSISKKTTPNAQTSAR